MQNQVRVGFYTQGCKLNFSETSTISRQLQNKGFKKVDFKEKADIYVINTCSVTENADRECKRIVRSALKTAPEAFVVVVGCYAQLQPEQISEIDGVDLVLGASEKFKLTNYINDLSKKNKTEIHSCEVNEADFFVDAYSIGDRTRAFLKVQDGCDYKCTYCTIPMARGISRSDKLENVLKNAKEISKKGIQEIVLTGVNIGDYGKGEFGDKKHEHTFFDLIKKLDEVDGINRIRISSIEPNLLNKKIIEFVSQSKAFVPHFHIPLQSGSDTLLKKMRRRYLSSLYINRVQRIKEMMPHSCIGADVIVGFPGETDADFEATRSAFDSIGFDMAYIFKYSVRPGTTAEPEGDPISKEIKEERNQILLDILGRSSLARNESLVGTTQEVLLEGKAKRGENMFIGRTRGYRKVIVPASERLVGELVDVRITDATVSSLNGELIITD